MEVVSKVVRAAGPSVSVVNPEERALGPFIALLVLRLHDIEDDGDTVFVIVPG